MFAMMGNASSRKKNFTEFEKNLLLSCIAPYKSIVESKQADGRSVRAKKEAWGKITQMFNQSTQINEEATPKQLNRLWGNMKQRREIAKGSLHIITTNSDITQNGGDNLPTDNLNADKFGVEVKVEDNTFSETNDSVITPASIPGNATHASSTMHGPFRVRRRRRNSNASSIPEMPDGIMVSGNEHFMDLERQLYEEKIRTQQQKTREARARAEIAELELALLRKSAKFDKDAQ